MTAARAAILVVAMGILFAAFAVFGDLPAVAVVIGTGVAAGGAALGLFLRRLMDRSVARSLSQAGPPGSETAAFEISSYTPSGGWNAIGTVTTIVAGDVDPFAFHDARRSLGLRLLKRLGLARGLEVGDPEFDREVYVHRNAEAGARLFASAEAREAARAIFRMRFFAIEYRHGLLIALRHGKVPDNIAAAVRPHLLVLARNAGAPARESQRPDFTAMPQRDRAIPTGLLVLDAAGFVLLALGIATQVGALDVIPVQFRFRGDGITFIVAGALLMVPTVVHVIRKARS